MAHKSPVYSSTLIAAAVLSLALPARADFRLERELALEPGGRFTLEADSGAIEIQGAERSGARVLITSTRDDIEDRFTFSFEESAGAAAVRAERRGLLNRWFSFGGDRLRFVIEVPTRTDLELDTAGGSIDVDSVDGTAKLRTAGGSVSLTALTGDVDAHTSGGSMNARGLRGRITLDTSGGSISVDSLEGSLRAETSGGSITVGRVSGDVTVETSGGSITVEEIGGFVRAHTSGGPVRVAFAAGNDSGGSISTSGGGVTATVDASVGLDIDAATSGGRVILDLPVTVRGTVSRTSVRGSLNGGGPALKLRSSGGSIRLRGL